MTAARQLSLLGRRYQSRQKERETQKAEIARVRGVIEPVVLDFAREHAPDFFIGELQQYVLRRARVAPASPDRILRDLRSRGLINYQVINRRASRYRFLPVPQ